MIDWTGTVDDPSGYLKFRAFLRAATERLESLGVATSGQMKTAANWVGSPSEWLGESTLAIEATLALPDIPSDLVEDLQGALEAIREGFRRTARRRR